MGRYFPFRGGIFFRHRKSLVSRATVTSVPRMRDDGSSASFFRSIVAAGFFRLRDTVNVGVRRARELFSESQRGGTSGYMTKGRSGAIFETRSRILGTKIWLSIWWIVTDRLKLCDLWWTRRDCGNPWLSLCFCRRIRTTSCLELFFSFFFPFLFFAFFFLPVLNDVSSRHSCRDGADVCNIGTSVDLISTNFIKPLALRNLNCYWWIHDLFIVLTRLAR